MCYVTRRQRRGSAVSRMTWSYVSKIYVCISGKVLRLNIREYKLATWLDSRAERWVIWLVVPATGRVRRLTAAIVIQYKTINNTTISPQYYRGGAGFTRFCKRHCVCIAAGLIKRRLNCWKWPRLRNNCPALKWYWANNVTCTRSVSERSRRLA